MIEILLWAMWVGLFIAAAAVLSIELKAEAGEGVRERVRLSQAILYAIARGYVLAVVSAALTFWYTTKLWRVLAAVWLDEGATDIVDPEKPK